VDWIMEPIGGFLGRIGGLWAKEEYWAKHSA